MSAWASTRCPVSAAPRTRLLRVPSQHRMPALRRPRVPSPDPGTQAAARASGDLADSADRSRGCPRKSAARNRADESWNLRVPVKAGARDVVVTFLNSVSALEETPRLPFERPFPAGVNIPETRRGAYLRSVEIGRSTTMRVDRARARAASRSSLSRWHGWRFVRADDPDDAHAPRVPAQRHDCRRRAAHGVLSRRSRAGRIRRRDRARAPASAREPGVPASRGARSGQRCARRGLLDQRRRARVAPLVLPLEQHSRRRVAEPCDQASAERRLRCSRVRSAG